ncbi:MAG: hypothetical protein WD036_09940 [Bauldia sp.]
MGENHRWSSLAWLVCAVFTFAPMTVAIAVEPTGRSVETETIIAPPDEAVSDDLQDPPVDGPTGEPGAATLPPDADVAVVEYDPAKLPTPVRRLREQIMAAAWTGDPENLKPIFEANGEPPILSHGDVPDPIAYLKSLSGDPEGREILAILIEVFEAGYVHVDVGTADEMYVWPYFARYPVDKLTPRQLVELFKLVYAGDYEDMKTYGHYPFSWAGIAPDGTWRYFIAGD